MEKIELSTSLFEAGDISVDRHWGSLSHPDVTLTEWRESFAPPFLVEKATTAVLSNVRDSIIYFGLILK
jgi:hypothetical protein